MHASNTLPLVPTSCRYSTPLCGRITGFSMRTRSSFETPDQYSIAIPCGQLLTIPTNSIVRARDAMYITCLAFLWWDRGHDRLRGQYWLRCFWLLIQHKNSSLNSGIHDSRIGDRQLGGDEHLLNAQPCSALLLFAREIRERSCLLLDATYSHSSVLLKKSLHVCR